MNKSIWQSKYYFKNFNNDLFVFNYRNKIKFDVILFSYIFCKFLNNFSNNYNYSKNYNLFLIVFLKLLNKFNIKGLFLFLFLNFNIIFISFFELLNIKVAGRFLKVPSAIVCRKSYRIVTKKFSNLLKLNKKFSIFKIFSFELESFENNFSNILKQENDFILKLVDNRMYEHFRWKKRIKNKEIFIIP